MARSTAEIQADIAVTRHLIEHRLDDLHRMVPDRWWTPYLLLAGGLAAGVLLSRLPLLRLVGAGARTVRAGLAAGCMAAAVEGVLAGRRRRAA